VADSLSIGRRAVRVSRERSSWLVAAALATAILAMPAMSTSALDGFRGLTYPELESLALAGAALGWLVTDRLAARGGASWLPAGAVAVVIVVGFDLASTEAPAIDIVVLGGLAGSVVRGGRRRSRDPAILVALATTATWVAYDVENALHAPMRDLHTYLAAARHVLAGDSPYLQGPLTALPDASNNPFIYPPFTIPFFEFLAQLPGPAVELGWLALSVIAVLAGLWLIGVRGRWVVALLTWPVFAIGLSVGNVAPFGFLCFALGYRFATSLVLGGVFKLQAGIPALWGLRERRFQEVGLGIALVASLAIATIPLTGWEAWGEWVRALGYFEQTLDRYGMHGAALGRYLPTAMVILIIVAVIALALSRRGRNGLARLGLASILASPTLYIHGFAPLLPGALTLRPEFFWFVSGIVAFDVWGFAPVSGGWVAMAIVATVLLRSRNEDLSAPVEMSEAAADLHPVGAGRKLWPDAP
jgi:hypothetical protein